MTLPFTSLDAAACAGAGAARDFEAARRHHTMLVRLTVTGVVTSYAIQLQGSHDAVNWVSLAGQSGTNQGPALMRLEAESSVRYVRANLAELSGGTSPTVTATIASV